ncbi:type II toxin-antitoxin system ParD family antitoxin [uncultured Christiangramia sp.]|uniref:type II toxin-antitoxin system ParD family antitoxin n=1 Tax=uncultured Christiangramia sp. TaxID=503836 RepID=UPI002618C9A8|nr:type II toxin-antitoxin system ParD family antitoxin [uncultured Christiangramia sp.]
MSTVRKSITFTEQQEKWIKSQIQKGHFTNDSEYIRNLVRQDQKRNDKLAKLKLAMDEGFESGVSSQSISDIMKTVEKGLRQDGKL